MRNMADFINIAPWWVLVGLTLTFLILFFRVARWSASVDGNLVFLRGRMDNVDKRLDNVDKRLDTVDRRLDTVDRRLDNVDRRLSDIDGHIGDIRNTIAQVFGRLSGSVMKGNSPFQLSEIGIRISKAISATEWAKAQAPQLVEDATGKEEFEIYDLCIKHVGEKFDCDSDFQRFVRAAAYEEATDIYNVQSVYHLELRDQVLELLKA